MSIPRPLNPSPTSFPNDTLGPIAARFYSSKPMSEIRSTPKIILQIPGGGFVTMNPKCHDDYTSAWSRQLPGIPIISLDYGKAPEHPYPWALEEAFDAYRSIVESNGEVIGLTGWYHKDANGKKVGPKRNPIQIVLVGDSAGANLGIGVVNKCLDLKNLKVPIPAGMMLLYPCLSLDMDCWYEVELESNAP